MRAPPTSSEDPGGSTEGRSGFEAGPVVSFRRDDSEDSETHDERMMARLRFYVIVVLPGAVLMALEMVSSRILAPQFGSSVYVWGSIIGVFLAAMSIGYVWGGRLADARPELPHLGRLLIGAAAAQAAVFLAGRPVVDALGSLTGGSPVGTLLATSILFGPPTILLATVAPYAVKLATRDLELLGGTAGHLYAISTGGSLVGTLGATFVLIPYLRLDAIFQILMIATVVSALLALAESWRSHRLAIALALAVLVLAFSRDFLVEEKSRLLVDRLTPYQTLELVEQDGVRFLRSDGNLHSAVEVESRRPWILYPRMAAAVLLFGDEPENLLILGMGGGSVGTYLHAQVPDLRVDYVDIDPAIPELAREFLFFDDHPGSRVIIDDARHFLQENPGETWDLVYADTYIGHSIPFHLSTVEFFEEVKRHLGEDGLFGVNLVDGPDTPIGAALLRSVRQVFRHLYLFRVSGGNYFLIATHRDDYWSLERLEARARDLDPRFELDPSLTEIVRRLYRGSLDFEGAQILRDDFAPVNHLLFKDRRRRDTGDEAGDEAGNEAGDEAGNDSDVPENP